MRKLSFMNIQPEAPKATIYVEYNKRHKMYEIRLGTPGSDSYTVIDRASTKPNVEWKLRKAKHAYRQA